MLIVFFATTIVFALIHFAPGDPFSTAIENPHVTPAIRAQWRHAYGLDQPLPVQYVRYLAKCRRELDGHFQCDGRSLTCCLMRFQTR